MLDFGFSQNYNFFKSAHAYPYDFYKITRLIYFIITLFEINYYKQELLN